MSENIDKEDFLDVDPKIPGQNFVCMSFVSPEKVLKKKELFITSKFIEYLFRGEDEVSKSMRDRLEDKEKSIDYSIISEMYEDWKYSRNVDLENQFYEMNDFRTTVRGIKIRGTYDTYREAQVRAKVLQRKDSAFHVFVGQVGYWLPWDPESDSVKDQEYQEEQLNELVKNYKINIDNKELFFEEEKRRKLEKARKEAEIKRQEYIKEHNVAELDSNKENLENINKLRDIVDEADKKVHEAESEIRNRIQGNQVDTNNFKVDSMESLETDDPWLQNKKSHSQNQNESQNESQSVIQESLQEDFSSEDQKEGETEGEAEVEEEVSTKVL
jgi:hypothetical protein